MNPMMNALRFSFRDRYLALTRVEVPVISDPHDVLIKVAYAGVCSTDLQIMVGNYPCKETADVTLGHEVSGVVAEVGTEVIQFQEGDKVTIDPNNGCKRCGFCHAGKPQYCKIGCLTNTIGIFRDGGWAEYVLVPEDQVYKLKPRITLEQAVLSEPLSNLAHGWDLLTPMCVGEKILLLGSGIVGNLWACALHLQGHRDVTVSEPSLNRLNFFKKLNTGFTLTTPEELKKNAEEEPEKYTFDAVIDCSGSVPAISQGLSLLNFGGKLCLFGVAPPTGRLEISPFEVFWKELKIFGVKINPFTFTKALGLLEAMGSRYLNYKTLGVQIFPLNEYQEAIESLKRGTIVKAVFKM